MPEFNKEKRDGCCGLAGLSDYQLAFFLPNLVGYIFTLIAIACHYAWYNQAWAVVEAASSTMIDTYGSAFLNSGHLIAPSFCSATIAFILVFFADEDAWETAFAVTAAVAACLNSAYFIMLSDSGAVGSDGILISAVVFAALSVPLFLWCVYCVKQDNFNGLKGSPLQKLFTLVSLCLTILTLSLVCVERDTNGFNANHFVLYVAGSALAGLAAIIGIFLDDNKAFTFNSFIGSALYGAAFISSAVEMDGKDSASNQAICLIIFAAVNTILLLMMAYYGSQNEPSMNVCKFDKRQQLVLGIFAMTVLLVALVHNEAGRVASWIDPVLSTAAGSIFIGIFFVQVYTDINSACIAFLSGTVFLIVFFISEAHAQSISGKTTSQTMICALVFAAVDIVLAAVETVFSFQERQPAAVAPEESEMA